MTATPRGQQKFEIALELLSDHPATPAWGNLGDWTATTEYGQACRQLALRVGQAAKLQPQDHVLDLACGDGASLQLWPEVFGVRHVTGLEYRARCVDSIRRQAPACLDAIVQGRFDVLPAPAELPSRGFDAALCVDAAYHAASLDAFAAFAAQLLRPQGRIAFTTLLLPREERQPALHNAWPMPFILAQAGIPAASVLSEEEVVAVLSRRGFADIGVEYLDAEVLQGFHGFIQRRRQELSWARKANAGWMKIQATAWLCGHLYRRHSLHYGLIRATRQ